MGARLVPGSFRFAAVPGSLTPYSSLLTPYSSLLTPHSRLPVFPPLYRGTGKCLITPTANR